MKCLIDGDVLIYQASFAGQYMTDMGELLVHPFDQVMEYLDNLIEIIKDASWCDGEPLIFITWDEGLHGAYCREASPSTPVSEIPYSNGIIESLTLHNEVSPFIPNFRYYEAVTKPYKGTRHSPKPIHYHNTKAYLLAKYDVISIPGVEADDAMAMYQHEAYREIEGKPEISEAPSVICSVDKDLRMIPGYHYTWPVGERLEKPLEYIDELGYITLGKNKIEGGGFLFFLSQLLTGDVIDNIPGVPLQGPRKAYKALQDVKTRDGGLEVVKALYEASRGPEWHSYFQEQSRLLWMVRELTEDGKLIGFDGNPYEYKIQRPITHWRNI